MARMQGKVALVTGAARGTGEATARLLVAEGARVVLGDVLDEPGEAVAKELGEAACYVHLDVTSESDWNRAVASALERFGALDVLVNNAGVLHIAAIEDTGVGDFERVLRVNQLGTFLGVRTVIDPMKKAGRGSIVNISSVDGLRGQNGVVAYCSSKWGVRGITRVAALELGRHGIRVNTVCPAGGSAEMVKPYIPEGIDVEKAIAHDYPVLATQKSRTIQDRLQDVARMVLFLASDESGSCTGGDFPVESGNTAGKITRGAPGS